MYRFLAGLLLLAAPEWAAAQAPAPSALDLPAALARGRAQARDVSAATARHDAARARRRQAAGHRLPTLRLAESWIRTDSPADAFGMLLNQERFSFPDFVAGDPNRPDPLETAISRVELEMPVWTGGEISTRIEQADLALEAAGDAAARAADAAAVAAGEAWLDLARAREQVALLERARETVAAHVERARAYAAQGMLVRSELLRAEVELARIDDLRSAARGGAAVAEANLAYRMGEPLGTTYELEPLGPPGRELEPLEPWLASGAGRADLAAARKRLAAGELESRAIAAGGKPRVGLVARRDWTDDEPFGAHGTSTTLIAAATFEIFDGGRRRAAAAAARADAEAGRSELDAFAEGIALEVWGAHAAARTALERHVTALAALEAAAESLRIVEERFRSGVVRTLDVLDAATARRDAEMRELVARTDARAALLRLALAAGRAPESVLETEPVPIPAGDPS